MYYAIRYKDGNIEDHQTDFKALTIREALEMAERFTAELAELMGTKRPTETWMEGSGDIRIGREGPPPKAWIKRL